MCFGGKSKAPVQQTTPPPPAPTQFSYVGPDDSSTRQRMAAVNSSTAQPSMASFGSDLGGGMAAPTATGMA
jgi:hypothetical protein